MRFARTSIAIAALAASVAACGQKVTVTGDADPLLEALAPSAGADASGKFISPDGDHIGNATLTNSTNGVLIRVDLRNLPEGWHGIHLHQVGDCSDGDGGFKASKGHINPDGNEHGLLNEAGYERADMPNIHAGSDGRATAAFFNSYVRLSPSEESAAAVGAGAILIDEDGFAMIIHANPDDHQTQPIGGAGPRIACVAFN